MPSRAEWQSKTPEHRLYRIRHLIGNIELHGALLESDPSLYQVISSVKPDEIYHLAAQSFVSYSFEDEFTTMNAKVNGAHYMLAAVRELAPQRAFILLDPARCSAIRRISRRTKKLFSARPPLWNLQGSRVLSDTQLSGSLRTLLLFRNSLRHESLHRDFEFVTRKITSQAARIKLGLAHELRFGNLDARRDWGHTREYVKAMWMMLQREHPDDYVIATGVNYSVRDFAEMAFAALGLELDRYLRIDDRYKRPAEVDNLLGDCPKAKKELGWEYNLTLRDLVREMVECDLLLLGRQTGIALAASVGGR